MIFNFSESAPKKCQFSETTLFSAEYFWNLNAGNYFKSRASLEILAKASPMFACQRQSVSYAQVVSRNSKSCRNFFYSVSRVFKHQHCRAPVYTLSELPSPCRGNPLGQRLGGPLQDEGYSGSHPHSFPGLY